MRNVSIEYCPSEMSFSEDHAFKIALGYLCSWCIDTYDQVIIWHDLGFHRMNLLANYISHLTGNKYTICAVWQSETETYSFHS
jgi:hypothetical protein